MRKRTKPFWDSARLQPRPDRRRDLVWLSRRFLSRFFLLLVRFVFRGKSDKQRPRTSPLERPRRTKPTTLKCPLLPQSCEPLFRLARPDSRQIQPTVLVECFWR